MFKLKSGLFPSSKTYLNIRIALFAINFKIVYIRHIVTSRWPGKHALYPVRYWENIGPAIERPDLLILAIGSLNYSSRIIKRIRKLAKVIFLKILKSFLTHFLLPDHKKTCRACNCKFPHSSDKFNLKFLHIPCVAGAGEFARAGDPVRT